MINRCRISRVLAGPVLVVALVFAGPVSAADGVDAKARIFIHELAGEAINALTKPDTPRDVRIERFRQLFNEHFAVRGIGKFVLGRHWRSASEAEQEEYLKLFEDLMVVSYVDRFQRYAGENLKIVQSRAENETTATVFTDIVRPGAVKPIRVLWRVGARDDVRKVLDVIVEGASMSQTLRSDFGSIIAQKGGQVSGLLEELRKKTAELKKQ